MTTWAEITAEVRSRETVPSAADLQAVAEYNARGDKERYGAHFADVEGLAAQAEVEDAQTQLIEWLAAQTGNDFAQSLVKGYQKYGSLTEKQIAAAERMRDRESQAPATTTTTDSDESDEVAELAEWLAEQTWSDFAQSLASFYKSRGYLSEKQLASAKSMKAKSDARTGGRKMLDQDGMYSKDGVIYKVQIAKQGSGTLYAKKLVVHGPKDVEWEYMGKKPLYELTADDKLSLEEAKKFGRLYGVCCNCGADLTDEDSIAAGIGPICAQGF